MQLLYINAKKVDFIEILYLFRVKQKCKDEEYRACEMVIASAIAINIGYIEL